MNSTWVSLAGWGGACVSGLVCAGAPVQAQTVIDASGRLVRESAAPSSAGPAFLPTPASRVAQMVTPAAGSTSRPNNSNNSNSRAAERRRTSAAAETTVTPRVFLFEGNSVISTLDLTKLVSPWIGKTLSFDALNGVVDGVRDFYQKRGYILASAFLPEQQINTGVVRIAVQEGKLGQVRIRQPFAAGVRVTEEQVQAIVAANIKEGVPVSEETLERPLLLIEDMAGASVRSSLGRGGRQGTADLELEVRPDTRKGIISGSAELDNFGNDATGRNRLTLKTDVNGLMRFGDVLSLQGFVTNQRLSVFGNAGYQFPVGANGMKAGVSVGKLSYSLGGEFAALEASGTARTAEANLSYPFVRSRNGNVIGRAAIDNKKSDSVQAFGSHQTTSVTGMRLQLTMDMRDARSSSVLALGTQLGSVSIADPVQLAIDQSVNGFKTSGRFSKFTYDAQHVQMLGPRLSLVLKSSGQLASKNLTGVEKFSLGGPDRVRGYLPGAGSGDSGITATAELRLPVDALSVAGGTTTINGFFDVGHVQRNRRLDDAPANDKTQANGRTLSSMGLGLRYGKEDNFMLRADIARSLSDANSTVINKQKVHFWVQSMFWF